jgi:hypothetical protein
MRNALPLALVLAITAPAPAHALGQPDHQRVVLRSCTDAALPESFCLSVARAAYDTDAESWLDPIAHAQIPEGGEACAAADATRARLDQLVAAIRSELAAATQQSDGGASLGDAARNLGRALHTLEDACAHSGMPNPQHAFLTDSDLCRGTHESPDIQPEAFACADRITDDTFRLFVGDVIAAGLDPEALAAADSSSWTRYPNLGEVCDFMDSAQSWDGVDRRWNNDVVLPYLAAAFDPNDHSTAICHGDPNAIARTPDPNRDVSARSTCALVDSFCLSSDLTRNDIAPPFYNVDGARPVGGCSLAPRRSPAGCALLLSLALGFAAVCRRSLRRP